MFMFQRNAVLRPTEECLYVYDYFFFNKNMFTHFFIRQRIITYKGFKVQTL